MLFFTKDHIVLMKPRCLSDPYALAQKKLHIRSLPVVTAVEEVDPDHLCALRQQQRYKGGARRFFRDQNSDGQNPGRRVRATHQ